MVCRLGIAIALLALACTASADRSGGPVSAFAAQEQRLLALAPAVDVPWDPPTRAATLRISASADRVEVDNYALVAAEAATLAPDPAAVEQVRKTASSQAFRPELASLGTVLDPLAAIVEAFADPNADSKAEPNAEPEIRAIEVAFDGAIPRTLAINVLLTLTRAGYTEFGLTVQGPTRRGVAPFYVHDSVCRETEDSRPCIQSTVVLLASGTTVFTRAGRTGPCAYVMRSPEHAVPALSRVLPKRLQDSMRTGPEKRADEIEAAKRRIAEDPLDVAYRAMPGPNGACPTAAADVAPESLAQIVEQAHALGPGCGHGQVMADSDVPWPTFVRAVAAMALGVGLEVSGDLRPLSADAIAVPCSVPLLATTITAIGKIDANDP